MPVVKHYEEHKRAAGVLDFVDLLVCTRELLVRDAAVRADLARRFTHYFVDEFQDTDPLQAEILMLLASDDPAQRDWRAAVPAPGRLFLVGDPKQSIYRFRRADVAIYEQIKERLIAHGAELVLLRASFRAVPAIQAAVNAAFEPEMQAAADRSQARYVALEPVRADAAGAARGGRGSGAAPVRRLRHGGLVEGRGVAARCGRRVRRLADPRERLDGGGAR